MDFLALVKRLASESGTELESKISSVDLPPATAYGETTEHRSRLVRWIQQAWVDIQQDQEQWDFMIERIRMDIVRGQVSYDIRTLVDTQLGEVIYDKHIPFVATMEYRYIWLVDGSTPNPNRNKCYFVPAEQFFGERDRYNDVTQGTPYRYSIDRKGCLVFDTTPMHDDYYVEFEFRRLPQELLVDTDVPLPGRYPPNFHILIVYSAMVFYAGFDESTPQFQRSERLRKNLMNKLRLRSLKDYSIPGGRS